MKDRKIAALLAFLGGVIGLHKFYLGKVGLGIFYCILAVVTFTTLPILLGIIDGAILLGMEEEKFDYRYNKGRRLNNSEREYKRKQQSYAQRGHRPDWQERYQTREVQSDQSQSQLEKLKQSGIKKFRSFDFAAAIRDFESAMALNPRDVSIHFNLACAYSLQENVDKAYVHLAQAVEYGFTDYNRILSHDALAYLRIQPDFVHFQNSAYRIVPPKNIEEQPQQQAKQQEAETQLAEAAPNTDLLEEIRQLNSLKELGLLTEEEFELQKRKLEA